MRLIIVATAMLLLTAISLYAQEGPPKYTIEIDAADVATLSQALNELPKRLADPLIGKVQTQLQAQYAAHMKAKADAVKPPPVPTPPTKGK